MIIRKLLFEYFQNSIFYPLASPILHYIWMGEGGGGGVMMSRLKCLTFYNYFKPMLAIIKHRCLVVVENV